MELFSKEFYDLMAQFEKDAKQYIRVGEMGYQHEDKEFFKRGWFYSDGIANQSFKLYMCGYSFGNLMEKDISIDYLNSQRDTIFKEELEKRLPSEEEIDNYFDVTVMNNFGLTNAAKTQALKVMGVEWLIQYLKK